MPAGNVQPPNASIAGAEAKRLRRNLVDQGKPRLGSLVEESLNRSKHRLAIHSLNMRL